MKGKSLVQALRWRTPFRVLCLSVMLMFIAVAIITCVGYSFGWASQSKSSSIGIVDGRLWVHWPDSVGRSSPRPGPSWKQGWNWTDTATLMKGRPEIRVLGLMYGTRSEGGTYLVIGPVPFCLVLAVLVCLYGYRVYERQARMSVSCCGQCGYSLVGNESGVCPECGEVVQATV